MYTAWYLPARIPGRPDPSRGGFATQEAAEEYVFSKMCSMCKEDRAAALRGVTESIGEDSHPSLWPACTCEWLVDESEEGEEVELWRP